MKPTERSLRDCLGLRRRTIAYQLRIVPGLILLATSVVCVALDPAGITSAVGSALAAIIAGTASSGLIPAIASELRGWRELANKASCPRTMRLAVYNHLVLMIESSALLVWVISSFLVLGVHAWMSANVPMKTLYFFIGFSSACISFAALIRWLSMTSETAPPDFPEC